MTILLSISVTLLLQPHGPARYTCHMDRTILESNVWVGHLWQARVKGSIIFWCSVLSHFLEIRGKWWNWKYVVSHVYTELLRSWLCQVQQQWRENLWRSSEAKKQVWDVMVSIIVGNEKSDFEKQKNLRLTKFRAHLFQNHPPLLSQVINSSLQSFIPKLNNLRI